MTRGKNLRLDLDEIYALKTTESRKRSMQLRYDGRKIGPTATAYIGGFAARPFASWRGEGPLPRPLDKSNPFRYLSEEKTN